MRERYLSRFIEEDLDAKMVFLGGPRQVGKTTLARFVASGFSENEYLNWDNPKHKERIINQHWPPDTQCLILDEIHKYDHWKNLVKGIWDTRLKNEKILVTGSSRLNVYRRSGDSLMGRYHYHTLHPFSLREYNGFFPQIKMPVICHDLEFTEVGNNLSELFHFGGFPEPLLKASERILQRWQRERFERIFREDIRATEQVKLLSQIELLGAMLPKRVASPLSLSSLAEDIQTSPKTISQWMDVLRRNYYCFRVMPYHYRLERALKKEAKYYLWDWAEVEDDGPRFENMIASHLLKLCDFYHDSFGLQTKLWYLRDREKREVDFLVTWGEKPWFMVECKLKKGESKALRYFADKLNVKHRFMVVMNDLDYYLDRKTGIITIPANRFLMALV